MGSKPRFKFLHSDSVSSPNLHNLEPRGPLAQRYKTQLYILTGLQDLSHETIEIYCILRQLIAKEEMNAASLNVETMEAGTTFEWLRTFPDPLVHRLISLAQYQIPQSRKESNIMIYRLFGNAGLAHIVMLTRNGPPWVYVPQLISSRTRIMSTRIRADLEETDCLQPLQAAYPEMMIWIIMMGGLASIGTEELEWFSKLFAALCFAADIVGTAELAMYLKEFLWTDFYLDRSFKEFWDTVAAAQDVEPGLGAQEARAWDRIWEVD
jgi:hypothetical protein